MNELKRLISQKTDQPVTPTTTTTVPVSQFVTATSLQYGWICPKCGAVMAPNQTSCTFCIPTFNVTTATPTVPPVSPTITCTSKGYSWD